MTPFVVAWLIIFPVLGSHGTTFENLDFKTRAECEAHLKASLPRMPDYFRGFKNQSLTEEIEVRGECISKLDMPQPGERRSSR